METKKKLSLLALADKAMFRIKEGGKDAIGLTGITEERGWRSICCVCKFKSC